MYYYFKKYNGRYTSVVVCEAEINIYLNPSFVPLTSEQIAFYIEHPNASVYEIEHCELLPPPPPPPSELEMAKEEKIMEIDAYDTSDDVNGFYYNGMFMWLDKATRVGLVNTLDSAEMLGRENVNIWYNNQICIELDIQSARMMLAALELYATDCYNVTALHKRLVSEMTTVEEVNAFDVTVGYPPMLHFGNGTE